MPRKVILDVDTGIDDALALLLAARSPELEIVGVTCVAGNVPLDDVVRNTLAVLQLAGINPPVAVGAHKPLSFRLHTATFFHGPKGLGEVRIPDSPVQPVAEDAAGFITRLTRENPGEITVVPVGPLTNIALCLLRDRDFSRNVAELVIMGGAVAHQGNATFAAEANFYNDPEAASAVARSGAPITLVDLGATYTCVLPMERVHAAERAATAPIAKFATGILKYYSHAYLSIGAPGPVLHDPLAVGLAAMPDLAVPLPIVLDVETCGASRGACIASDTSWTGISQEVGDHRDTIGLVEVHHNAAVAREVQADRFIDLFLQRLEMESA